MSKNVLVLENVTFVYDLEIKTDIFMTASVSRREISKWTRVVFKFEMDTSDIYDYGLNFYLSCAFRVSSAAREMDLSA